MKKLKAPLVATFCSVAAFGTLFYSNPARATDCYLGWNPLGFAIPECTPGYTIVEGDKQVTLGDFTGFSTIPSDGIGGIFNLEQITATDYAVDISYWHLNPNGNPDPGNGNQAFSTEVPYTIDILSSASFEKVLLDATWGGAGIVEKGVDGFATLVYNGTTQETLASGKSLNITDFAAAGSTQSIVTIRNGFIQTSAVPGPLPLLGAGAAFGYSRKLRSRVKLASSVEN